jgi:hypothetical protein
LIAPRNIYQVSLLPVYIYKDTNVSYESVGAVAVKSSDSIAVRFFTNGGKALDIMILNRFTFENWSYKCKFAIKGKYEVTLSNICDNNTFSKKVFTVDVEGEVEGSWQYR